LEEPTSIKLGRKGRKGRNEGAWGRFVGVTVQDIDPSEGSGIWKLAKSAVFDFVLFSADSSSDSDKI